jgi:hypothetical protein
VVQRPWRPRRFARGKRDGAVAGQHAVAVPTIWHCRLLRQCRRRNKSTIWRETVSSCFVHERYYGANAPNRRLVIAPPRRRTHLRRHCDWTQRLHRRTSVAHITSRKRLLRRCSSWAVCICCVGNALKHQFLHARHHKCYGARSARLHRRVGLVVVHYFGGNVAKSFCGTHAMRHTYCALHR